LPETSPVGKNNVPANAWGEACLGWTLVDQPNLHVIEERMPPGTSELRHVHESARQFYFVLQGTATVEFGAGRAEVKAMHGIEIPPRLEHQMRNESGTDLEFLVISTQRPREDRQNV
jgi:mannose-6-phosphate isomerase-like protein (cupin superfamily)